MKLNNKRGFIFSLCFILYTVAYSATLKANESVVQLQGTETALVPPTFSHKGGFYKTGILLHISHPDPSAIIVYTLDGSEPLLDNLEGKIYQYKNDYTFETDWPDGEMLEDTIRSFQYTHPIEIENRSAERDKLTHKSSTLQKDDYFPDEPVFKGTVIRARVFTDTGEAGGITTETYFVNPEGRERFSLPVISLALQEDLMFDYHLGIYTPGADADKWRENNPTTAFTWPFVGNFHRRGDKWEYPGNIEYFANEDSLGAFNHELGIRLHGGGSRSFPMKSLRLYARAEYGQSKFEYPFFSDNEHDQFNRLLLRNSGNDFPTSHWGWGSPSRTMFRDAFHQTLVRDLKFDTQDYSPLIVFINGEYWGIHNLRERFDKHYLARVYDLDENNIDMVSGTNTIEEGDNSHYIETLKYIEQHGVTDPEHYQHVITRIDPENYIDYQITNIYINNVDWPGNNIMFWRYKKDSYEPDSPYGFDGRWRWLMYDTDFGYGLWHPYDGFTMNTLAFATEEGNDAWPNPDWSTFLLRNMLKNSLFREQFINRFADLLNTTFRSNHVLSVIDSLAQNIAPEIGEHFQRWASWESTETWQDHVEILNEYARQRPAYQKSHLLEYFNLEDTLSVELDVSHQSHGYIRINTIDIKPSTSGVSSNPYPWKGCYFKNIPIVLSPVPAPGYRFSHWEGSYHSSDSLMPISPTENIYLKAHFVTHDQPLLVHYWMAADQLPNDTPLETMDISYSILDHRGFIEFRSCFPDYPYFPGHSYWRKGSMERRNSPTSINYRLEGNNQIPFSACNMRGLQIKQPLAHGDRHSSLVFHLPTRGISDPVFKFVAMDEGAANALKIEYSVTEEENWLPFGESGSMKELKDFYQLFAFNFSHTEGVNDNPNFKIRIHPISDNPYDDSGKRVTLNNISLDGKVCMVHMLSTEVFGYGDLYPKGDISITACSEMEFKIEPDDNYVIENVWLDGLSILDQVVIDENQGGTIKICSPTDNHFLQVDFVYSSILSDNNSMIVYPNPVINDLFIDSENTIFTIQLVDVAGRIVLNKSVRGLNYRLPADNFANGIYLLRIITDKEIQTKKIQIFKPF